METLQTEKKDISLTLDQDRSKSLRFRNRSNIYERRFSKLNESLEVIKSHLDHETSTPKRTYSDISEDDDESSDCILVAAHYPDEGNNYSTFFKYIYIYLNE